MSMVLAGYVTISKLMYVHVYLYLHMLCKFILLTCVGVLCSFEGKYGIRLTSGTDSVTRKCKLYTCVCSIMKLDLRIYVM